MRWYFHNDFFICLDVNRIVEFTKCSSSKLVLDKILIKKDKAAIWIVWVSNLALIIICEWIRLHLLFAKCVQFVPVKYNCLQFNLILLI